MSTRALAERYRGLTAAETALAATERMWDDCLGAVQVHPRRLVRPDRQPLAGIQTLSCRIWARSGRISPAARSGSGTSCRTSWPCCMRAPICAGRICCKPRRGSSWRATSSTGGTRRAGGHGTRCSDDLLWLPCGLALRGSSGDESVLDEPVTFLEAPLLDARTKRMCCRGSRPSPRRSSSTRPRHHLRDEIRRARPAADPATGTTA